jgi:hypothetical protein
MTFTETQRKGSAKRGNGCSFDAALLSSDDQFGGATQPAVINDAQTRKKGRRGGVGQTTVQTKQDHIEEHTSITKTLLNLIRPHYIKDAYG